MTRTVPPRVVVPRRCPKRPAGLRSAAPLLVVVLLAVAACGTRESNSAIVAAASLGPRGALVTTATGGPAPVGQAIAGSDQSVSAANGAGPGLTAAATGATTGSAGGASGPSSPGSAASPNALPSAPVTAGSGGAVDPSLPTVNIGNIGEYSGPVAASLGGGQPMAAVLSKWLNANGGLNRHPVRVIVEDNGGDPSRYLSEAKDLVENQHVIAFVGNQIPLTAPGADQYLRSKGVPVISGEGAHSLWITSPVMYFPGTAWAAQWVGMADIAAQLGMKKLAILYCGEAEPCLSGNQAFTTYQSHISSEGISVVYRAQVSIVQPDYTSECLQAKNNGANAIVTAMDANSLSRVVRSCKSQGYNPLYLTGGLALVTSLAQDPNMSGVTLYATGPMVPWVATDLPAEKEFHNAIQAYNPSMDNSEAAVTVWVGGQVLRAATAHVGPNPTSADIVAGLATITNDTFGGLTPPISFPSGQSRPKIGCYFVVELSKGNWSAPQGSKSTCTGI